MKKALSIFICAMMVLMMNPVTSHASGTWYNTSFSGSNTSVITSESFDVNSGSISCEYDITPSTSNYISSATITLQYYDNGSWRNYSSKEVDVRYPSSGGSVDFGGLYTGTFRVKISCDQRVKSMHGIVSYYRS